MEFHCGPNGKIIERCFWRRAYSFSDTSQPLWSWRGHVHFRKLRDRPQTNCISTSVTLADYAVSETAPSEIQLYNGGDDRRLALSVSEFEKNPDFVLPTSPAAFWSFLLHEVAFQLFGSNKKLEHFSLALLLPRRGFFTPGGSKYQ